MQGGQRLLVELKGGRTQKKCWYVLKIRHQRRIYCQTEASGNYSLEMERRGNLLVPERRGEGKGGMKEAGLV